MPFQNPKLLLLIVPVLAVLVAIIRKDFVKIKKIQGRSGFKSKIKQRTLILISRSIIFSLLIIAMASPFTLQTIIKSGDPTLTILLDNSSSMEILDTSRVNDLTQQLEKRIPVRSKTFSFGDVSAVGDAIIASIDGNDNILLISDGNSNHGRSLGDMLILAATLNSTINAIDLQPVHDDSAVVITGPRITTNAEENEFKVIVKQVGSTRSYELVVSIDNENIFSGTYSGSNIATVSKKFSEGYHTVKAEITSDDYFEQNNVYYKIIKVEPRPKVLLIRSESTPLSTILTSLYQTTTATGFAGENLYSHSAVILDNIPASDVDINKLSNYVIDGNGLVVFGGKNAYDRGSYKDSLFEGMLPVRVGKGKEGQRTDVNIAFVIDISASTGSSFGAGSKASVEEVEKALAVGILQDLRKRDDIAIVAFNTEAFIVSDLVKVLGNEAYLENKIKRLVYKGGTRIDEGIKAARKILAPLEGSKNMIIFSDGVSSSYPDDLYDAQISANTGIKIFTIGVGEGTNRKHLQDIARAGNGFYFEPDETQRLKVIFGESEASDTTSFPLEIINSHHFITSGLKLSGKVSGFNQVVPKPNAELLVATQSNNPLLTVSRLGLGRIAAISTDDGRAWAPELLSATNSRLITRTINWAVGDLSRNKDFDVNIKDIHLGSRMVVNIISSAMPTHDTLTFTKIGKRLYTASFTPQEKGIQQIFSAPAAVNYESEYTSLGLNPQLGDSLAITGGKLFTLSQADALVEKVKEDSKRIISEPISYSWMFLLAALIIFLIEVGIRRIQEGKANK